VEAPTVYYSIHSTTTFYKLIFLHSVHHISVVYILTHVPSPLGLVFKNFFTGPVYTTDFPIPNLYTGKIPIPADGIFPGLSIGKQKNTVGVIKNIPLTIEGIIRRM
jgi:hypothetical protein